jgi:hypothetical protein
MWFLNNAYEYLSLFKNIYVQYMDFMDHELVQICIIFLATSGKDEP